MMVVKTLFSGSKFVVFYRYMRVKIVSLKIQNCFSRYYSYEATV